jgi:hypothetical protein
MLGLFAALALGPASEARAEDTSRAEGRAVAARERGLPITVVELDAGLLALPAAEVCFGSLENCSTGEISLSLGLRNFYQFGRFWIGGGIVWGTTLRSDDARGAPELEREHSRRYFLVEPHFRYSFIHTSIAEAWVGTSLGMVSVRDAWTVAAQRDPVSQVKFVAPEALVVGSEGVAVSVSAGGSYIFADNFSIGGRFRYGNWVLPGEPSTSTLGDLASLSGRVDVFELTTMLAYRLAL